MNKISIYQVFTRLFGNMVNSSVKHGSSFENGVGKMSDFSDKALCEIRDLGITHIWYTGIIEHARCEGNEEIGIESGNPKVIKGRAGSPYAITDYYDVNPDIADNAVDRIKEFEELVVRTHKNGLNVIIDFVPNHVARNYGSDIFPEKDFGINDDKSKRFSPSNDHYYIPDENLVLPEDVGTILPSDGKVSYEELPAKATGNDQFTAYPNKNDWYETVKLNYGVNYLNGNSKHFDPIPSLWDKMVDILLYWESKGVDAFRCDMVEMVPVEFWEYAISKVKAHNPNIVFIAEVYNPDLYESYIKKGGFDYLYDKVGLYDSIKEVVCHNVPVSVITLCWQSLRGIDSQMLRFLENHDEQRYTSRFFAGDTGLAVPAMMTSTFLHQGPIMTYFGQEVGEPALGDSGYSGDDGRTTIFDYYHVPEFSKWVNGHKYDGGLLSDDQRWLRNQYKSILNFAIGSEAIGKGEFYDLMWVNSFENEASRHKIYAFLRYTESQRLLIVVNFSRDTNHQIVLKVPEDALCVMGLKSKDISCRSVLFGSLNVTVNSEELSSRGVWLNVVADSGLVIELCD